MCSLFYLLIAP